MRREDYVYGKQRGIRIFPKWTKPFLMRIYCAHQSSQQPASEARGGASVSEAAVRKLSRKPRFGVAMQAQLYAPSRQCTALPRELRPPLKLPDSAVRQLMDWEAKRLLTFCRLPSKGNQSKRTNSTFILTTKKNRQIQTKINKTEHSPLIKTDNAETLKHPTTSY